MKVHLFAALSIAAALSAQHAFADDRAACLQAASQGETFRDAHKLIEAREQFRICAQQRCPAVVQKDCASWLDAAERGISTVVLSAKDDHGVDLADVTVTVDGQPLATKLDGVAVPLDAGRHTFHFEWSGGAPVDQALVIHEGEKDRSVAVVLPRAGGPATPAVQPAGGTSGTGTTGTTGATGGEPVASGSSGSGMKTAGWVVGGVGVVGLAVGVAFGVSAISDKSAANCGSNNECTDHSSLSKAKTAAVIADVGIIGGGVLTAAGIVLLVLPSGHSSTGALQVAPMIGAGVGGMSLAGHF